MVLGANLHPI